MRKIVGIVLNVLIGIIIIISLIVLYNLIQTSLLRKDYTNFFGYTALQIATGSMRDTLYEKDIIIVKILDQSEKEALKEEDIIVYKKDNSLIVHRIINVNTDTLITKGDANNAEDKPIQRDIVIGKMVKVIPKIGIWEKVLTEPRVYASVIITLSLFGITFFYGKGEENANKKS